MRCAAHIGGKRKIFPVVSSLVSGVRSSIDSMFVLCTGGGVPGMYVRNNLNRATTGQIRYLAQPRQNTFCPASPIAWRGKSYLIAFFCQTRFRH